MDNEIESSTSLYWKRGPMQCILIGDPACPILKRWTLKTPFLKFRIHKFFANTHDRDTHDHPWPFLTFVLWGSYDDINLDGKVDHLRIGSIRYRSAIHAHKTFAGPKGCITFVVSPYESREWGFFPEGKWMHWRKYMKKFGSGMQCDE